jgi:hypothetical protein
MKLASLRERYVCSSLLLCVRKETDGEDAHARSRRPDSRRRMRNEMERVSVEVVSPFHGISVRSFVGDRSSARAHDAEFSPFVTNTGCKIYDDRA